MGTPLLAPCTVFMDLREKQADRFPQYGLGSVPFEDDRVGLLTEIGVLGDSASVDHARDVLEKHPEITLEDTSMFYCIEVFNACERGSKLLLTRKCRKDSIPRS